jgi:hypothetical protein
MTALILWWDESIYQEKPNQGETMMSLLRFVAYTLFTLTYIVVVAAAVATLWPYGEEAYYKVTKKAQGCPCGDTCKCPEGKCPDSCPK